MIRLISATLASKYKSVVSEYATQPFSRLSGRVILLKTTILVFVLKSLEFV
jgi:hypothetical protein